MILYPKWSGKWEMCKCKHGKFWGQTAGVGTFRQDISKILKISTSDGASLFASLCGHNHKQGPNARIRVLKGPIIERVTQLHDFQHHPELGYRGW